MSAIFELASSLWREMHHEYCAHRDQAFLAALEATHGVMVNKAGRERGIEGYDLFYNGGRHQYASWELIEWWEKHPRPTLARFEIQWMKGRGL